MKALKVVIDGENLTIDDVYNVSNGLAYVEWSQDSIEKVTHARKVIDEFVANDKVVYGVTTGFGKLSSVKINSRELTRLQENLVRSHASGVGNPLSAEETKAAMLIRANVLAKGYSGVRPIIVENLIKMINKNIIPLVPEKGSVGASGDLAPSAHIALVLMGEGRAKFDGKVLDGSEALRRAGIEPIKFQAKEGLAVLNGTQVMAGIGCILVKKLEYLTNVSSKIAALSNDVLWGTDTHFDVRIQKVRPHPGQIKIAADISRILSGSSIRVSHLGCKRVQDAYSLRCIPQVHGAVWDTIQYARNVITREINSATDNPLIFPKDGKALSGGNFHGEPIAFVLDFLSIAISELASISERRIERMINPDLSEMPAFLTKEPGLNSGFMIAQLTAVSLVSENKILAHPASVDSLPTSANKEDHVSMGMTAALKLRQIAENVLTVLAIEMLIACQALDLRRPLRTSPKLEELHAKVRKVVPFMERDRNLSVDIKTVKDLMQKRII